MMAGFVMLLAGFVVCVAVSSEIQDARAEFCLFVLCMYTIGFGCCGLSCLQFKYCVKPELDEYDERVAYFNIRICFPHPLKEAGSGRGTLRKCTRVACVLSAIVCIGCFLSYFVIWIMMLTLRVQGMEVNSGDHLIATVMLGLSVIFATLTVILFCIVQQGLDAGDFEYALDWAGRFFPEVEEEPPSDVRC
jgi:hypothetical protein